MALKLINPVLIKNQSVGTLYWSMANHRVYEHLIMLPLILVELIHF